MTVLTTGYIGARTCTDGPTVGAKNLMAWHLRENGARGGYNLGIYNCRTVRGGSTTSVHGEGRAADLGVPTDAQTWSWGLAEKLRLNSKELGIQCIIHNHPDGRRLIWSCSGVSTGWREYGGVDHDNHLHVELTWAAANGALTVALLDAVLKPAAATSSPIVTAMQRAMHFAADQRDGLWGPHTDRMTYLIRQASYGNEAFPDGVVKVQQLLGTPETGTWNDSDREALKVVVGVFQRAWGVGDDGDWGAITEAAWAKWRVRLYSGV